MSVRLASRRLFVGGTSAALLAGVVGFIPLLGTASAASCPSWTDPKEDSGFTLPVGTDPSGMSYDSDLDIISTTVGVTAAGGMEVVVGVAGLKDVGPDFAPGDQFVVNFAVAGTATKVTLSRDTRFTGAEKATMAGAATATGKAVFDLKTSSVTGAFTPEQVKTAFGKPVAGLKLDGFETLAYGYTLTPAGPALGFPLHDDAAPAAALTYTDAGGCEAGGAPAASGSATPDPSGSATPDPSGSATPDPSGSATPDPSGSATPSPSPSPSSDVGSDGLFVQPRKGCASYTDPAGDADPTGIGESNEGSLDVTQVNLKSPAGALNVIVKLAAADEELLDIWSGRIYETAFTVNSKVVALSAPGDGPATATVGGTENKDIKATAKVDAKASTITFAVPLEGLNKAVGATVQAGTPITASNVTTSADSEFGAQSADTAAGTKPEEKTYAYGDNHCFMPPPGKLAVDADPRAQYTDTSVLFATLTDEGDVPVQGARVVAVLSGGRSASAVTDAEGVAEIALRVLVPAGTKVLSVAFSGTPEVGAVKKTQSFGVLAEKVLLRASGIRGGARALLLDDDRRPVASQLVTFTVGSKRYSIRTGSTGIATLTRIARGSVIKVAYAGSRGYYLATPTATVKAG